ncbi:efflux RND transporter periplasmic adaptor subunit [Salinicola halophilus]|uniref:efflux RND transporter periplasmic adaptor subunit n=1 Tax=Salinicola halophilus TaxID=184065 RepID=UPI000DA21A4E|nr:efflux RND transporter periplasmic adaptor subunit [Salinicola halophilus]
MTSLLPPFFARSYTGTRRLPAWATRLVTATSTVATALIVTVTFSVTGIGAARAEAAPTAVMTATVQTQTWRESLEALGTLRADESVTLSATVTGRVEALNFDDGESVDAGQWLVQLEDDQARASLRAAEALREQRQNAVNRAQQLQDRNLGVRATLEDSTALVGQSEAEIDEISARIDDHRIRAPFAGTVGLRELSQGALVTPGTELVTLDKLDVMKLDFTVPATLLSAIRPGLALDATTPSYPGRIFEADVATIGTRIDAVSRSLTVRARLDNAERLLRPGMLMIVTLSQPPRQVLSVPEGALVPDGERQTVWLLDAQDPPRVSRREITIGERRDGKVEVLEGLAEGDRIVTHGTLKVRADDAVESIAENVAESDMQGVLERQRRASASETDN